MRVEELEHVCREAARDLAARESRPLPPTVVLPDPRATRLIRIPEFPDGDHARTAALDALAREEISAAQRPAYGFVAEGELDDGTDVVVVVFGAHGVAPRITAAAFEESGALGAFTPTEPLDPAAMPFLHPLQHAVEEVRDVPGPDLPGFDG
jgi:hypothetical protein